MVGLGLGLGSYGFLGKEDAEGRTFAGAALDLDPPAVSELEVVLVNSKSNEKPIDPLRRAQTNLNGGGNTDENRVMTTPLAAVNDELAAQASEAEQRVAKLEGEARRLMDRIRAGERFYIPQILEAK